MVVTRMTRYPALHIKPGMQVVEEGWRAERLKGPQAVRRFSFQPSNLSAFGSGSEPTLCARPPVPYTRYPSLRTHRAAGQTGHRVPHRAGETLGLLQHVFHGHQEPVA